MSTLVFGLCVSPALVRADVRPGPTRTFVTNGTVSTVLPTPSAIYIGGRFTSVGPRTGPGVGIDASTANSTKLPMVAGGGQAVLAVEPDGSGGFFIGGDFTRVGLLPRTNLAHILPDGKVDPSFNPRPNGAVRALALSGQTLYVGGSFGAISFQSRHRIAALDATTGQATSWNPNSSGTIRALEVSGHTVYAGGQFRAIGGQSRFALAAIDATTGEATSWNPNVSYGVVNALAVSGGTVYAGGTFRSIGGQSRNFIGALDANTGKVTSWDPAIGSRYTPVYAIAVSGKTVYVGGEFTSIGGQPRVGIAALDATTAKATSWDPAAVGSVHAIAISGQTVYVGGIFSSMGGHPRNNIAAVDATTGKATSWAPNAQGMWPTRGEVDALAPVGPTVYAGGRFNSIGGERRHDIAALDPQTGIVTSWDPEARTPGIPPVYEETNTSVDSLAISGQTVYVAGEFTSIGGQSRNSIAAIDASTGEATSWNPNAEAGGYQGLVKTLAVSGQTVYAGGYFDTIGGQPRSGIAALDATTGKATGWDPNALYAGEHGTHGGAVYAFAVDGTTVYAGGHFTSIGGQSRHGIAALDSTTGKATDWDPQIGGYAGSVVNALGVSGQTVYAGGEFTSIGGQPRNDIAALDATTGKATSWDPGASIGPDAQVNALAFSGQTVYAGGFFRSMGGQPRFALAALDATSGAVTGWNPQPVPTDEYGTVGALASGPDGSLWAGGGFSGFPAAAQSGIARFSPLD